MTNKVTLDLVKTIHEQGEFTFSTNHNEEIVEKWLYHDHTIKYRFDNEVEFTDMDEDTEIESTLYEEVDDDLCPFDEEIQEWINSLK